MFASLGLVAVNWNGQVDNNSQIATEKDLFLSDTLSDDEKAYQSYLARYGKSYGTQKEYKMRFMQF